MAASALIHIWLKVWPAFRLSYSLQCRGGYIAVLRLHLCVGAIQLAYATLRGARHHFVQLYHSALVRQLRFSGWYVVTSHPRSFSPSLSLVSRHFSCYTALPLLASKCFSCELSCLEGLLYVISGILAGDPWFRSAVLLHSHNGMAMLFLCLCFRFVWFRHTNTWVDTMLSPLSHRVTELDRRSLSSLCFWCLFLFGCVFVCSVALGVSCCLLCFVWNRDGCWTMYRSHTSSLLWPPTNGGKFICINS